MDDHAVDAWLAHYDNAMRDVVQRVRQILLQSDDRITETIKWKTPTFQYKGDLASFYPNSEHHATLIFHAGATIPGTFKHLEPGGPLARGMRIVSIIEAEERRDELEAIVAAWIRLKDSRRA